jgi:uracil-DNA glycosylase family 4
MKREEAVLRELNLYPLWKLKHAEDAPMAPEASTAILAAAPTPMPETMAAEPAVRASVMPEAVPEAGPGEASVSELDWAGLKARVKDCTLCPLRAGCTQTVFGVGDEQADWLFVGEGPGADEDAKGEPFVGQAGKLLDNMLMSIKLKRVRDAYIANIVKCRPPNNRAPTGTEAATCMPYLQRQIALIQPRLIVALGKTAANALIGHDATISSLRGKMHEYRGIPMIVTYHPAYLLRTPADKARAWQDLCLAVDKMNALKSQGDK